MFAQLLQTFVIKFDKPDVLALLSRPTLMSMVHISAVSVCGEMILIQMAVDYPGKNCSIFQGLAKYLLNFQNPVG